LDFVIRAGSVEFIITSEQEIIKFVINYCIGRPAGFFRVHERTAIGPNVTCGSWPDPWISHRLQMQQGIRLFIGRASRNCAEEQGSCRMYLETYNTRPHAARLIEQINLVHLMWSKEKKHQWTWISKSRTRAIMYRQRWQDPNFRHTHQLVLLPYMG
jgi:hypothetical protein